MPFKPLIGFSDDFAVKTLLASAGLVTGDQQNGPSLRIERKSNPPNAIGRVKPQLLHICVSRALEGINTRPSQVWAELLKQPC